jgi:glycosyltransferase involved in cell wall biosynthesis
MQPPTVSVMIPTYNSLCFLQEAVASVLNQTLRSWELIIVDDGSSDGTGDWLRTLRDPRVRAAYEAHTGNLAYVRNVGISLARAPWLAFLDADDVWLPAKLERQLAFHAAHPDIRWSYTARSLIDARGDPLPGNFPWQPVAGWILLPLLVHRAGIASPTMMIHRSLLSEIGTFDEQFPFAGDYDLRLRLAVHAECGVIDEPLVRIRRHDGCRTVRQPAAVNALANVYRKFRHVAPSSEARTHARRQESFYRLKEAQLRFELRQWAQGWRAVASALRVGPLDSRAYRAAASGGLLMGRDLLLRTTRPPSTNTTAASVRRET